MKLNRHDPATAIPLLMKATEELDRKTEAVSAMASGTAAQKMYRVDIYASRGNLLRGGITSTELRARVYSWDYDVTDEIPASCFAWSRNSGNEDLDAVWNEMYGADRKKIMVIAEDVGEQSTFLCTVTDNDKMFAQSQIVVSSNHSLEGVIESVSVVERQIAEIEENTSAAVEAAETARENAESALQEMDTVNGEIEAARQEREALHSELTTLKSTMEADYATKGELTEIDAHLSSEIERNAAQISSTVSQVEQIGIDAEKAIADAGEAKSAAETAQNAADEAQRHYEILQQQADVTDEQLAAAKIDVQNAQLAAETAQNAAETAQAAANSLYDRVVEVETAITQNSNSITLLASRTTKVEENLDNLEIGGRNLALKTGGGDLWYIGASGDDSYWQSNDAASCFENYQQDEKGGDNAVKYTPTASGKWLALGNKVNLPLKQAGTYTFSLWIKADSDTTVGLKYRNGSTTAYCVNNCAVTTSWQRVYGTFSITEIPTSHHCWIETKGTVPLYTSHWKVETGNKPTDWTPAPEDSDYEAIQESIEDHYTAAVSTAEEITSSALQNYVKTEDYDSYTDKMASELSIMADRISMGFEGGRSYIYEKTSETVAFSNYDIPGRNLAQTSQSTWSDWITPPADTANQCYAVTSKVNLPPDVVAGDYFTGQVEVEFSGVAAGTGGTFRIFTQGPWVIDGTSNWNLGGVPGWQTLVNLSTPPADGAYKYKKTAAISSAILDLSPTHASIQFRTDYWDGVGKFRWRLCKIEKGSAPTEWTPAPEHGIPLTGAFTETGEQVCSVVYTDTNTKNTLYYCIVSGAFYKVVRTDEVAHKVEKLCKIIDFSNETAITIRSSNSEITLELDNEKGIVFKKNGVQFGLWDGENFFTGNIIVQVNERAQFGNFAFVPRSDGSLMFLKVGD